MKPKITEKEIQNQIRDWLTLQGHRVIRVNSGAVFAEYNGKKRRVRFNDSAGCCDLLVCLKGGRFAGLEVKTPERRNEVTFDQQLFIEEVLRCGGIAGVVCSVEDAEAMIARQVAPQRQLLTRESAAGTEAIIDLAQSAPLENPGPGLYSVTATVVGSKYLGEFHADSPSDAIAKALRSDEAHIGLCHQCSDEAEDIEIDEDRVLADLVSPKQEETR